MNSGNSIRVWWSIASKTKMGDLIATAAAILIMFGMTALAVMILGFFFHWGLHFAVS
ncbi:MAG TPA: hypothetical protein VHU23_00735 [Rhizomicrobium sp.]|jgi:hypothetical protein|nr:hypothetical protein [Rhizomicrobium sp.]